MHMLPLLKARRNELINRKMEAQKMLEQAVANMTAVNAAIAEVDYLINLIEKEEEDKPDGQTD